MLNELGIGVARRRRVPKHFGSSAGKCGGMKCGSTEPRIARRQLAGATSVKKISGNFCRRDLGAFFVRGGVYFSAAFTGAVLLFILGYIIVKGLGNLSPELFSWNYTSENCSLMPALVNTLLITLFALLIACPLGIGSAIYLVEYSKKGNRFVKLVRLTTETLTGIPSIIYGLFGMIFFVGALKWGYSLLAGSFTLAIMILPTVMRTTEEALLDVPDSFREASFGLGAGKLRTVFKIVLPSALPGIFSGVILATGRIVSESAALIYTAGTVAQVPQNILGSGRSLAIHMYLLSSEGLHTGQAFATALILLLFVLAINSLAGVLVKRAGK